MQKIIAIIKALLVLIELFMPKKQATTIKDSELDTIDAGLELAKAQGRDEKEIEEAKAEVENLRAKSPAERAERKDDVKKAEEIAKAAAAKTPKNKKSLLSEFRGSKK